MATQYKKIVQKAQELMPSIEAPVFPEELLKLQSLLNKHEIPDFQRVSSLISQNPYLAAELVSLANTPIFNPSLQSIKDLDSAIFRLGTNQIKDYIFSIHIKKHYLDKGFKGLSFHSQTIALISVLINKFIKVMQKSEAFFLGLVHDIGTFAIHQLDNNYGLLFTSSQKQFNHNNAHEFQHYGTSHSAFGYVLAKNLRFPDEIALTLLFHHEPEIEQIKNTKVRKNVALLVLAHMLSLKTEAEMGILAPAQQSTFDRCCRILQVDDKTEKLIHEELDKFYA